MELVIVRKLLTTKFDCCGVYFNDFETTEKHMKIDKYKQKEDSHHRLTHIKSRGNT